MANFPTRQTAQADMVAATGRERAAVKAQRCNQAYIAGHRLAKRRKAPGLSQLEVAERTGVTKNWGSRIERGEMPTVKAIAHYMQALGDRLQTSVVFGDDLYILRGTDTHTA